MSTGRLARLLAISGVRSIHGVNRSEAMLSVARRRLIAYATTAVSSAAIPTKRLEPGWIFVMHCETLGRPHGRRMRKRPESNCSLVFVLS